MGNVNKVDKSKFFDTKEKISIWLDKYNIDVKSKNFFFELIKFKLFHIILQ